MNKTISWINNIKTISIIMVIITHVSWSAIQTNNLLFPFTIDMAVPFFMILSGHNLSKSIDLKDSKEIYSLGYLLNKIYRFTLPFIFIFIVQIIDLLFKGKNINIAYIIKFFLCGGTGPGSYYYPIMIQLIFYFYIIFQIMKSNEKYGLIICFFINLFFEMCVIAYKIDVYTYRLLIFRYTFLISCGVFYYLRKDSFKFTKTNCIYFVCSILVGGIYIYINSYTNYSLNIFKYWSNTSMMTAFWAFPLFVILNKLLKNCSFKIFDLIGKSSYHIFLFQIIYYIMIQKHIIKYFNIESLYILAIMNVFICITCGVIFYVVLEKTHISSLRIYK